MGRSTQSGSGGVRRSSFSGSRSGGGRSSGGFFGDRPGLAATLAALSLIMAILLVAVPACRSASFPTSAGSTDPATQGQAPSAARVPLGPSQSSETAWYRDDDGTWIDSPSTMESGLKDFYRRTGVRPYVHILPNGSAEGTDALARLAQDEYDELFDDEGHFLLVFCDDGDGSFDCGYAAGSDAATVMDDEAVGILADKLDRWYQDYSITEEEIFSNAFRETGELIMAPGATSGTQASDTATTQAGASSMPGTWRIALGAVLGVAAAVLVTYLVNRFRGTQG